MFYKDRVYGKIEIKNPLVLELINTPFLQRLKKIDQIGFFEPHFPGSTHSRFEHSLGVFLLLKKFGASLEEQIAGLIHDVSHSAFSHCIDYVLAEGSPKNHSHQDSIFADFIKGTKIPKLLEKYQLTSDYILNEKNFPLKEKDLPALCADRIDYSLRQALISGEVDIQFIKNILSNLTTENKKWVFKDFKTAKNYAELFLKLNRKFYAGFASALMFTTVGDFLKYALEKGYLKKTDLYTTDKEVLEKIKPYLKKDKKLKLFWQRMNNKIKAINSPSNFDVQIFCKSRIVDPLFKKQKQILRVSKFLPKWRKVIKKESEPKEYFIKFEK